MVGREGVVVLGRTEVGRGLKARPTVGFPGGRPLHGVGWGFTGMALGRIWLVPPACAGGSRGLGPVLSMWWRKPFGPGVLPMSLGQNVKPVAVPTGGAWGGWAD